MGHEVGLIYGNGTGRGDRQVVEGVTCIDAAPLWKRPASVFQFWQAMTAMSPDLLYTRIPGDFAWMMGLHARCRSGARFIYAMAADIHCDPWKVYEPEDVYGSLHAYAYALGLKSAHVIAIQHQAQEALISPCLRSKVSHIPNLVRSFGTQPRAFEAAEFDALWIGMIRPEKRLQRFLDLAASLPDLKFAVVGGFASTHDPGEQQSLRELMERLQNLTFFGPQNAKEVHEFLRKSRILVNTSPDEGFPNTMLEAWSVGVPVVSLSVDPGGVITRERLGLVSGSLSNLRRDVLDLVQTKDLNEELGILGLDYVRRHHSLDIVHHALMQSFTGIDHLPIAHKTS
jgi:glycosyltransferase involved in cell wall biosynthesis